MSLNEGQTIPYDVVSNRGKESAENLKPGALTGRLDELLGCSAVTDRGHQ
jgi:hypothetical protein